MTARDEAQLSAILFLGIGLGAGVILSLACGRRIPVWLTCLVCFAVIFGGMMYYGADDPSAATGRILPTHVVGAGLFSGIRLANRKKEDKPQE